MRGGVRKGWLGEGGHGLEQILCPCLPSWLRHCKLTLPSVRRGAVLCSAPSSQIQRVSRGCGGGGGVGGGSKS